MYRWSVLALIGVFSLFAVARADVTPKSAQDKQALHKEVQSALTQMENKDPGLKDLLNKTYAYAIFPSVAKGGLIVGGAYGKGEVYRAGNQVGYADLSQGSFGLQAGGKQYAELVLFENENAFKRFQQGNFAIGANASAIALKAGASASVRWQDGVAVITMPEGGLMAEVSISGQKLNYAPMTENQPQPEK